MLPIVSNIKTAAIASTVALALALPAAPALAWGKNEQQFTTGVLATLLIGAMIRDANHKSRQPEYQPQPVYQPPYQPPVYQPYQPAPSYYQTPAAQAFNSYSRNERIRIQATLTNYGYYHGALDGSFGRSTYEAVANFAQAQGKMAALQSPGGAYGIFDGLIY